MAPIDDKFVPHEAEVTRAVDAHMVRTSDHAAIADLTAASASYVQAEATATRTTLNNVLAVLRDAELIPSS